MGITDSQKTAITAWTAITATLWSGWLVAKVTVGGQCERPELVKDFNREDYLGRWYEMYREKSVPFEEEDCATATYVELPSNYIEVNNIEYSLDEQAFLKGDPSGFGKAQCSSLRSGLCQVKFFELSPWSDYSILYTDYTTHSVVYGCDTFGAGALKFDWLWALTRVPNAIGSAAHDVMTTTVFDVINDKLEDFGEPTERLRPTEQTTGAGCVYSLNPVGKF